MSTPPPTPPSDGELHCSFCNRSRVDVRKLIAGPSVYICDACVELCWEILSEEDLPPRIPSPHATPFARRDSILVEVKRAIDAAFPETAAALFADLERIAPKGGPLICDACGRRPADLPRPCPEDFVCTHWQRETWKKDGWKETPGAGAWPWLEVFERQDPGRPGQRQYVVLAPLILRTPLIVPQSSG